MKKRPQVVVFETPKVKNPFKPSVVKKAIEKSYYGEVSKDGKWLTEAAAGWRIKHISTGVYEVSHFTCNKNICLSLSLINEKGTIRHSSTHDMHFTVEIKDEKEFIDRDFSFSISFLPR